MKEIIKKHLGYDSRMLSASKGRYVHYNPNNIVVFNANVCTREDGKIWYGDIDITLEEQKLTGLANELQKTIYVLREMDGRFENEEKPLLDKYVYKTDGIKSSIGVDKQYIVMKDDGKWYYKEQEEEKEPELPEYDDSDKFNLKDYELLIMIPDEIYEENNTEEVSPLEVFYAFVVSQIKSQYNITDNSELKNFSVYITEEANNEIKELMREWFINVKGFEEGTYELKKNMTSLFLAMPFTFYGSKKGPRWAEKNIAYIKHFKGE